jgi:glycosyltransferase involved in cell wall biosynthesis
MKGNKRRKHILITTHGTAISGAEIALVRIIRLLNQERFSIIVALPGGQGAIRKELAIIPGVKVLAVENYATLIGMKKINAFNTIVRNPTVLLAILRMLRDYVQIIDEERVDLILTSSIKTDYIGAVAGFLTRTPVIWYMHDFVDSHYFPAWVIKILVWFGRLFPKIVICNSAAGSQALRNAGIPAHKLLTVHYPPLPATGKPDSAVSDIRAELGLKSETRLVTMVGRICPPKGQYEFVQAAAGVKAGGSDVVFLIVGDSVFGRQDEIYKQAVTTAVATSTDPSRVRLLGMRQDAVAIMGQSDVVVFNSLWPEGFGLAVAEALEQGIPVVSTALGGTAEMIEDGVTGIKVEPGDVAGLSQAIMRLLANPQEARGMALAGQQRIRQLLSVKNVRRLEDIMSNMARAR